MLNNLTENIQKWGNVLCDCKHLRVHRLQTTEPKKETHTNTNTQPEVFHKLQTVLQTVQSK